jgi:hypothetical protein
MAFSYNKFFYETNKIKSEPTNYENKIRQGRAAIDERVPQQNTLTHDDLQGYQQDTKRTHDGTQGQMSA